MNVRALLMIALTAGLLGCDKLPFVGKAPEEPAATPEPAGAVQSDVPAQPESAPPPVQSQAPPPPPPRPPSADQRAGDAQRGGRGALDAQFQRHRESRNDPRRSAVDLGRSRARAR